jgi:murein DD-endopeptidase MepM/ murein hydrolase activator NlpD
MRGLRCTFFWGVLSAVAIGAAGCSGDTSRFGENPNGNSYATRAPSYQSSAAPLQPAPFQPTRAAAVERQPLPQAPPMQSPYAPQHASLQYEQPQYAPPAPQYAPPAPQYAPPAPQYAPPAPQYAPPAPQYAPPPYEPPASRYAPPTYVPPPPQYASPPSQYASPPYGSPPYAPAAPGTMPDVTGPVRGGGNWDRGASVVVAPGDTVDVIARRYGVPAQAVIQANNITNPAVLSPGQRLVIPRYVGAGAKLTHAAAPRTLASAAIPQAPASAIGTRVSATSASSLSGAAPAQAAAPTPSMAGASAQTLLPTSPVHTVASGDTLGRVAHKYRVSVRDIAIANGIAPQTPLKIGMQLTIPVKVVASTRPGKLPPGAPVVAQTRPTGAPYTNMSAAPAPGKLASSEPAANVRMASPVETSSEDAGPNVPNGPNGVPAFRWPTRGRIVNNFGAKVNGSSNDGIDLAVPEGTQVRAADDGVVAYAGNELKGYGNLVLVRHSNGFVTAYANASELLVRRNDQVHKGQVILKSGQTGNATAPQLHFEIRKNSAPVDPMQFLPADKTASAPL